MYCSSLDKPTPIAYTAFMQTLVLVGMLTDLLIKRKVSRKAFSEKYELSERTVTRYIDVLAGGGVPIESRKGLGGGYVLPERYKLDRFLFSDAERARIAEALRKTMGTYEDGLNQTILDKLV